LHTDRLIRIGHGCPLVLDHGEELSVVESGEALFEFFADLVLEEEVRGRGTLGRVGILFLGDALALAVGNGLVVLVGGGAAFTGGMFEGFCPIVGEPCTMAHDLSGGIEALTRRAQGVGGG
jgi:hypothetical protein